MLKVGITKFGHCKSYHSWIRQCCPETRLKYCFFATPMSTNPAMIRRAIGNELICPRKLFVRKFQLSLPWGDVYVVSHVIVLSNYFY